MRPRPRRALIVVSAYAPAILADMHRARMLAWELPRLGWNVEVLTPRASEVRQDAIEPKPEGFFAPGTPDIGRLIGARPLRGAGVPHPFLAHVVDDEAARRRVASRATFRRRAIHHDETFIYFSLGPRWTRLFNVPYVLDFHDPWLREESFRRYARSWRARLARQLSERMERAAVMNAAGMVSVSPNTSRRFGGAMAPASRPGCRRSAMRSARSEYWNGTCRRRPARRRNPRFARRASLRRLLRRGRWTTICQSFAG